MFTVAVSIFGLEDDVPWRHGSTRVQTRKLEQDSLVLKRDEVHEVARRPTVVYGKMDKDVNATDRVDLSGSVGLWERWKPGRGVLSVTRPIGVSEWMPCASSSETIWYRKQYFRYYRFVDWA